MEGDNVTCEGEEMVVESSEGGWEKSSEEGLKMSSERGMERSSEGGVK